MVGANYVAGTGVWGVFGGKGNMLHLTHFSALPSNPPWWDRNFFLVVSINEEIHPS